jgi:hypothetical protein
MTAKASTGRDWKQTVRSPLFSKILVVVLLMVAAFLLVRSNLELMRENRRMIKFIKNSEVFEKNMQSLERSEATFSRLVLRVQEGSGLEKLKTDHIDKLLNIVKTSELKTDSYNSEIEKKDGFVIFKTNVTIVGDFVAALRFFALLRQQAPHIYVAQYDIRRHLEKQVRLGLMVEVLANE